MPFWNSVLGCRDLARVGLWASSTPAALSGVSSHLVCSTGLWPGSCPVPKARPPALEKKLHERSELMERDVNGICECQHADQTYLKEMIGRKTLRKGGGSVMKLICELSPWARSALLCRKLWLFPPCEGFVPLFPGTNICFQSTTSHFSQVILVWLHHSQRMDLFRIFLSFKFYCSALGFIHPWDQVLALLCPCGFPDQVHGGKWKCFCWIFT